MSSLALVQSLHENLSKNAGVRNVFGEAIHSGDQTILPVARVAYGFGGGSGPAQEGSPREGGGGGAGVRLNPVGIFVISPSETRFVAAHDRKRNLGLVLVGVGIGVLLARRRRTPELRWKRLRVPL
ncbi:MAG TPA: spore germination protein GerW family protein [Terriglobales bacterium]|jgi:uncharacterized spore protein YtfJ